MDEKHLHHPLLPLANYAGTTTTKFTSTAIDFVSSTSDNSDKISSNVGIAVRLIVVLLTGVVSIWANHEASKGFVITVIDSIEDTPAREKFNLFYVSNDEAIRLVQSSSSFAAKVLFPGNNSIPEKLIDQVDVHLVSHNLANGHTVAVKSFEQTRKYVLSINSQIMEFNDFRRRIRRVIQRGMAEILLFNQQYRAPKTLLDGMVEYISALAGLGSPNAEFRLRDFSTKCWEDQDPRVVAKFLAYSEMKSEGFVRRLFHEINSDGWYEKMMDKVLGTSAMQFCVVFHDSMTKSEDMVY